MATRAMEISASGGSGGGEATTPALLGVSERSGETIAGGGGGITVTHTRRALKSYNFTDSDLDAISLSNVVSGVSFSLAAAVATFCIDINKDIILAGENVSQEGAALHFTVNWIGIPLVVALAVVGILALTRRGNVISRVKRESENVAP